MPSIGTPQYSSAAGPARPTAPISAAVLPAMVYAGALPATAMTTESNMPRTFARRPSGAATAGDAGSVLVVIATPESVGTYAMCTKSLPLCPPMPQLNSAAEVPPGQRGRRGRQPGVGQGLSELIAGCGSQLYENRRVAVEVRNREE